MRSDVIIESRNAIMSVGNYGNLRLDKAFWRHKILPKTWGKFGAKPSLK